VAPGPGASVLRELDYRFEVCRVLETQAISRAAASATRDVGPARSVLASLNQVMLAADAAEWHRLDVEFHRRLNDQSGNLVLAAAVERTHRELPGPGDQLETLWRLQADHRRILECVERGQADEAVRHTRAHLRAMHQSVVAALSRQRGGREPQLGVAVPPSTTSVVPVT